MLPTLVMVHFEPEFVQNKYSFTGKRPVDHRVTHTDMYTLTPTGNLLSPVHLSCMSLDCEGNQHQHEENLQTPQGQGLSQDSNQEPFCCELIVLPIQPHFHPKCKYIFNKFE